MSSYSSCADASRATGSRFSVTDAKVPDSHSAYPRHDTNYNPWFTNVDRWVCQMTRTLPRRPDKNITVHVNGFTAEITPAGGLFFPRKADDSPFMIFAPGTGHKPVEHVRGRWIGHLLTKDLHEFVTAGGGLLIMGYQSNFVDGPRPTAESFKEDGEENTKYVVDQKHVPVGSIRFQGYCLGNFASLAGAAFASKTYGQPACVIARGAFAAYNRLTTGWYIGAQRARHNFRIDEFATTLTKAYVPVYFMFLENDTMTTRAIQNEFATKFGSNLFRLRIKANHCTPIEGLGAFWMAPHLAEFQICVGKDPGGCFHWSTERTLLGKNHQTLEAVTVKLERQSVSLSCQRIGYAIV
jgi:hypothetical protein